MFFERTLRTLRLRLRSLFRRQCAEAELQEELEFHLQSRMEQELARGVDAATAQRIARRALGNVALAQEESRATWGWTAWHILWQDLRYAGRTLRKSPGFTLTALLTLVLGIGASTAVFTLVDSVLLRPLSYRESGRLVAVWETVRFLGPDPMGPNPRHADLLGQRATSLHGLALVRQGSTGLVAGDQNPHLLGTVWTTPNLFDVLQVTPHLGRLFGPEHALPGRDTAVILTHGLWQTMFRGDPNIIGKSLRLGDIPREVIGVLPANFHFPNRNALRSFDTKQASSSVREPVIFLPAVIELERISWGADYGNWVALARLRPTMDLQRAQAELTALLPQITQFMPAGHPLRVPGELKVIAQPLQEAVVARSRPALGMLLAAVGGLMLIACINLANTQLARSYARQRETSVRTALGAPRWRLVRMVLMENLLVAVIGGAGGVLLASAALRWFRREAPVQLPRLDEVQLNATVLCFSLALIVASAVFFSVLPTLHLLRPDPQTSLQQGGPRSLGSRHNRRLHAWLIGLQVFGCTALLLLTALFTKNLIHLITQPKGFAAERVAFAQVALSGKAYASQAARVAFIDGVLANVRALSGVQQAGYVSAMLLEGESWIESVNRVENPLAKESLINLRFVSHGYLEATGHKLVAGRFFEERDRQLKSVVLSEGEARALWPSGQDPIGKMVTTAGSRFSVIGVVADSRTTSLKDQPVKYAYLHYTFRNTPAMFFMARGTQPAADLVGGVRQAIWKHAPGVAIARVKTMDDQVTESLAIERFQTVVLAAFGIGALLLAMIGIHGVLSFAVATRRQEMGVRVALGAARYQIYALAFGEVTGPVLIGLAAGVAASLAAGRAIKSLLFGIQGFDTGLIAGVAAVLLTAAFVAGYWPARRAAAVDPMASLRVE